MDANHLHHNGTECTTKMTGQLTQTRHMQRPQAALIWALSTVICVPWKGIEAAACNADATA
eukprot:6172472-Pleurochrysis_carterae.AAC.3